MSGPGAQLTMALGVNELCVFENFHAGRNSEVVTRLERLIDEARFAGVWLWGPKGRGASHLLQAVCQRGAAHGLRAHYLPLAALPADRELLDGLAAADLLAIDDLERWVGNLDLETALMALYQALLVGARRLVIAADAPPVRLDFLLPDLASRLRALEVHEVRPLDDQGLREVLRAAAQRRGLVLEPAVLDYWLFRAVRELPVLLADLERLDGAALAAQRRVTIPLVKAVLKY